VYFVAASLTFNSSVFNSYASTSELNISSVIPRLVPPSSFVQLTVSGSFDNVVSVSCGGSHSCSIHSAGALSCWGRTDYGQLKIFSLDWGIAQSRKIQLLFLV
jgi:alpha-tubulin suppressor-like RCC1 family protein